MAERVECPRCKRSDPAVLAGSDTLSRFQCRDMDCLEVFTRPKARPPLGEIAPVEEKGKRGAMGKELCAKGCGREFVHEKRRLTHEGKCDGPRGTRAAPATRRRMKKKRDEALPATAEKGPSRPAGLAAQIVELVHATKKSLEKELATAEAILGAIQKVERDGDPT